MLSSPLNLPVPPRPPPPPPPTSFLEPPPFFIICYWKSWNEQILNRILRNKRFNLIFTEIRIFLQNVRKFPPFYPALINLIPQGFSGDDFCF